MKNRICFLTLIVALTIAVSGLVCSAEEEKVPSEPMISTVVDAVNCELTYKLYDVSFYEQLSKEPGIIVPLEYTTDAYGDTIDRWANVYLPYGYDETKQYNIIYFLHGTNENQDSLIGDVKVKNALDNMILAGDTEPFIMVCPTYYYDYETRSIDMPNFVQEVRKDLMPLVESTYSTYAETADEAGFIASREHRAFAGYSRGSYATWHMFCNMLDYSKWYMPFSGAISGADEMSLEATPEWQVETLEAAIDAKSDYKDDFFVYIACGGKRDMMYDLVNAQVDAMLADTEYFSFGTDPAVNNFCYCISPRDIHQTLISRYYFYNAFGVVFH